MPLNAPTLDQVSNVAIVLVFVFPCAIPPVQHPCLDRPRALGLSHIACRGVRPSHFHTWTVQHRRKVGLSLRLCDVLLVESSKGEPGGKILVEPVYSLSSPKKLSRTGGGDAASL